MLECQRSKTQSRNLGHAYNKTPNWNSSKTDDYLRISKIVSFDLFTFAENSDTIKMYSSNRSDVCSAGIRDNAKL